MTPANINLAAAAMGNKETVVNDLCRELEIIRQTLYRYVSLAGNLPTASIDRLLTERSLAISPIQQDSPAAINSLNELISFHVKPQDKNNLEFQEFEELLANIDLELRRFIRTRNCSCIRHKQDNRDENKE